MLKTKSMVNLATPDVSKGGTAENNRRVSVAVVQSIATGNLDANLAEMRRQCEKAKANGAEWVCFAEMIYYTASSFENRRAADRFAALKDQFAGWAKELGIYLMPGSLRSPGREGARSGKSYNHLLLFDPQGNSLAEYKKIFLFKANLPERRYDESELYDAGDSLVTFETPAFKGGLAICFDLRFPELFRALRKRGAEVILVPSAFTVPTGRAHWEILLRARAIENQCFVIAPSSTGECGDGSRKYGHSLVVDPWGEVLQQMGEEPGQIQVTLDLSRIAEVRKTVDSLASQRPDLFPIA